MEHLSARLGGLYGMPELHILIQDTVNGTLKNLRGIVETHVHRTLEAEQCKVVKDMALRLLTEEVLRVTERSAHALTRREMASVEINQKRLFDSLAATDGALEKHAAASDAELKRLSAGLEWQAVEQQDLRGRIDNLVHGLHKLETSLEPLPEMADRISRVFVLCADHAEKAQDLQKELSRLEQSCAERYAEAPALRDLEQEVGRLSRRQEEKGDEWLCAALKPYALKEEVAQGIAELKAEVEDRASWRHEATGESMQGMASAASDTQRGLDAAVAEHRELRGHFERERADRGRLHERLRAEVATLRDELAPQASVDRSFNEQRKELSQLAGTVEEAQAKADAGHADLRVAVGEVRLQMKKSAEAIRSNEHSVVKVWAQIAHLNEAQAKILAGFADEKARAKVLLEAQYGNRQELHYLTERVDSLSGLGVAAGELTARANGQEEGLVALSKEVAQWTDAIAAQQGLRRDAANLRSDLEELRRTVAKLQEEQAQGIQQLRKLHTKWLVPKS